MTYMIIKVIIKCLTYVNTFKVSHSIIPGLRQIIGSLIYFT